MRSSHFDIGRREFIAMVPGLAQGVLRAAGQQLPVFRVEGQLVSVPVVVTNKGGRVIANLKATDFQLFEDGAPQTIKQFEERATPVTTVLAIDSSGSMDPVMPSVRAAAARFIELMHPEDVTEILQFNTEVATLLGFSSDKAELVKKIQSITASGATAMLNGIYQALREIVRRKAKANADFVRTAIIVLSDGDDTASGLVTDVQVLREAGKAEVPIYSIRLTQPKEIGDPDQPGPRLLASLAEETGGRFIFASSVRLDKMYEEIARELHTQYTLGYTPTNQNQDGKWRKISVSVRRRGVRVRCRSGYYAERATS